MRKNTRGRHVQHFTGRIQGIRQKQKGKIHLHGSIRHLPEKPSPALDAPIGAKFVHYKLTEGYRRRVAAGKW